MLVTFFLRNKHLAYRDSLLMGRFLWPLSLTRKPRWKGFMPEILHISYIFFISFSYIDAIIGAMHDLVAWCGVTF